jgi:hypothetical protein
MCRVFRGGGGVVEEDEGMGPARLGSDAHNMCMGLTHRPLHHTTTNLTTAPTTDTSQPQYERLKTTYYWTQGLYIFNPNDMGGNFVLLVIILIDASLIQPFTDALAAVKPHRKPLITLFFVSYYVLGQLIVLNVVVAFILDGAFCGTGWGVGWLIDWTGLVMETKPENPNPKPTD